VCSYILLTLSPPTTFHKSYRSTKAIEAPNLSQGLDEPKV